MPDGFPALPSLNALRVFEVVARHLNFRLAAEELGVTQAAVAQQVRGLEASLGLRLFERLPRGLALTDAGLGYSASIRNALAMIDEATRLLRPQAAHLTVSVTPTFSLEMADTPARRVCPAPPRHRFAGVGDRSVVALRH